MSGHLDTRSHIAQEFVSLVAERGYPQAKVSDLTVRAGIARTRFYELFTGKQDCFIQAQQLLAAAIVEEARLAIAGAEPSHALLVALTALTDLAGGGPAAFAFLTHESTLAGAHAWDHRKKMIGALAGEIERAWERLPEHAPVPDLDLGYLLGGAIRALGIRMRRGEERPKQLLDELTGWAQAYQVAKERRRWSSVTASAQPSHGGEDVGGPLEPAPLPRGRHRIPPAIARRSQRERLVHATGHVAAANGYAKTTVAEIVAAAGVSREVFYEHFHDKQEAFADTIKFVFEQLMAGSAGAFFSTAGPWPERIWQTSAAFVGFLAEQPSLVHAVFVEPYAGDVQRPDDFVVGFTLFLEDGFRYRPEAARVPRIAGEAIGGVVLEAINTYMRSGRTAELPELTPALVYTALAPFMGPDAAYEFVMGKARESSDDPPAASG